MYNGIINVHKEAGFTSHDVVAKLRGILKQKKIGHTGTLDPDATGVLPVCLGNGTKLCDMLTDKSKEYETVMLLGIATDTEDISGTVIDEKEINVTEKQVKEAIESFTGEYSQIPPMYSALKVNGQKLCDLARKGVVIERTPRPVVIHEIEILEMKLPRVRMRIHCSKGTYIRSLCRDIGDKLGCGACMEELKRTRVGIFETDNSYTLNQIEKLVNEGRIEEIITGTEYMFDYPKLVLREQDDYLVKNGNMFRSKEYPKIEDLCKVYLSNGILAGIYGYDEESGFYKPKKMFLSGK